MLKRLLCVLFGHRGCQVTRHVAAVSTVRTAHVAELVTMMSLTWASESGLQKSWQCAICERCGVMYLRETRARRITEFVADATGPEGGE